MAVRIRLQRHGKKSHAFYHIVAADSRSKRDGKFIEKLGTYNPNTNPATIEVNLDASLKWVQVGAEMSDTARAILSYKGVLYKNHLLNGVKKGAFSAEEAEKRFNAWLEEKAGKIDGKKDRLSKSKAADKAKALEAEAKIKEARAVAIEAKNKPAEEETPATEEVPTTDVDATAQTDAPAAEENKADSAE